MLYVIPLKTRSHRFSMQSTAIMQMLSNDEKEKVIIVSFFSILKLPYRLFRFREFITKVIRFKGNKVSHTHPREWRVLA